MAVACCVEGVSGQMESKAEACLWKAGKGGTGRSSQRLYLGSHVHLCLPAALRLAGTLLGGALPASSLPAFFTSEVVSSHANTKCMLTYHS